MQILKNLRNLLRTKNEKRIKELVQQHKADQILIKEQETAKKIFFKTIELLESDVKHNKDLHESVLEVLDSNTELIKSLTSDAKSKTINKLRANLRHYTNKKTK